MTIEDLPNTSYIAGKWVTSEHYFPVNNPFSGDVLAHCARVTDEQLDLALTASVQGFDVWRQTKPQVRAQLLTRWAVKLREKREVLSTIITLEQGKPLAEARAEVDYGIAYFDWFAGEAVRNYGHVLPSPSDQLWRVERQPVGVVAAITPWNFPFAMIARKLSAALAAGCSVLLKPSELTPMTAIAMVDSLTELVTELSFPKGLVNLILADDAERIGDFFTASPAIAKLSFTGSTAVGRQLNAACAKQLKRVSMELGGNAPFIVCQDANISHTVRQLVASKLRNSGQTCISVNRILVHKAIKSEFIEQLIKQLELTKAGSGLEPDNDIGPLIEPKAYKRLDTVVKQAIEAGANIAYKQQIQSIPATCYPITILTGLTPDMLINHHELFGPVFLITEFESRQHVIDMANQTAHGLAAYVFSGNGQRAEQIARQLTFGMVGINKVDISDASIPFGGVKDSGFGREGSFLGMDDYLEYQYLSSSFNID